MSAASLIERLERVKATGPDRWMARCPAHEDRGPSLSIREVDQGRVLLYCFAQCDVESILDAVGLTFADIMPERVGDQHSYKPSKPNHWHAARDALRVLSHEVLIVAIAGENIANGIALSDDDRDRVSQAASRIRAAREATQ